MMINMTHYYLLEFIGLIGFCLGFTGDLFGTPGQGWKLQHGDCVLKEPALK